MTATASTPTASRVPAIGERAPDFSLQSTAGAAVKLSDFRGKSPVLLAFFPLAFTSTCTAELCEFSESFDQYTGKGVTVLPVSVDSVPTLLSDFKREASRAFGVLREDTFFSERAYFLIDRDGVVRWAHVESRLGDKRDNHELFERIAALG